MPQSTSSSMISSSTTKTTTQSQWLRNIFIGLAFLAVLIAAAGATYQSLSAARDRRSYPMQGQLVDVGGYKMHIQCLGKGTPTVILDSGLGDSYLVWHKVQPQIAEFARVCSYDRAGLGYSDASPRSRSSEVFAEELHALLKQAGIAPPYILVGHSMGGYDVRLFASMYRSEVAGMVLVDSSHPEQQKRFPPALNDLDGTWLREQEFMEFAMPFGIPRLLGFCGNDAQASAADCNFHSMREGVAELKSISVSAAQAARTGFLGDIPLAVLTQDPDHPEPDLPEDLVEPTGKAWQQMQNELARLSRRSTHVIAKNSGHYIQLDRPDLVIAAVHRVFEQSHLPK